ncbi:MAG: hypothetical protein OXH03_10530 [Bacteroidetes bacterium]|nr:hypothetical protein [Bacteroidota bacterium]MDE2671478.1 hypothetical protein [Bacteroidota bacterium]
MRRTTITYTSTAVLLALIITVDASAQIRFAGDNNGLSVNGKIIDTGDLHESLFNVAEILSATSDSFGFQVFADGAFPMRAKINGATYEIWRDRIIESCEISNADHEVQIHLRPDPLVMIGTRGKPRKLGTLVQFQIRRDPQLQPISLMSAWTRHEEENAFSHQVETSFLVYSFKGDGQQTDLFVNYGVGWIPINDQGDTLAESTQNYDSFKGDGQQTDLLVNYGVRLEPMYNRSDGMAVENANISTFLINDQGDTLVERTRHFDYSTNQVKAFPDKYLWVDTQQMQVSSDARDLMVVQKADGQTTDVWRREIKVPGYDQAGLRISDVMLAYSVEQTGSSISQSANEIVRKGFSILPAARNVYSTEWPVYLYFEVYGLALNARGRTDYDVEITLEPKNADYRVRGLFRWKRGREGVSVGYKGNSSEPEESLYQILDVSDQKTGLYTLTLTVRDNETGEESERVQDLFLQRWGLSCSE